MKSETIQALNLGGGRGEERNETRTQLKCMVGSKTRGCSGKKPPEPGRRERKGKRKKERGGRGEKGEARAKRKRVGGD